MCYSPRQEDQLYIASEKSRAPRDYFLRMNLNLQLVDYMHQEENLALSLKPAEKFHVQL